MDLYSLISLVVGECNATSKCRSFTRPRDNENGQMKSIETPKKRKGKAASTQPYALKKRLDDTEARKIAPRHRTHQQHRHQPPRPLPIPDPPRKPTPPPRPQNAKSPARPSIRDAATSRQGIVIHGIALRKDLGKVRRWLEEDNKDMGKTAGIRWLRNKETLQEEGKKTSSVVLYLEEDILEMDRVRLGGRWLRACRYEWDR
ncbi:hypothetical protein BDZ91DRAFT_768216 [Kalaharituber pfeilii]|nr:hypothetical protein BDZ91DRAFT_768216 [Kalaharituber pfeilii]